MFNQYQCIGAGDPAEIQAEFLLPCIESFGQTWNVIITLYQANWTNFNNHMHMKYFYTNSWCIQAFHHRLI